MVIRPGQALMQVALTEKSPVFAIIGSFIDQACDIPQGKDSVLLAQQKSHCRKRDASAIIDDKAIPNGGTIPLAITAAIIIVDLP